MNIILCGFMGCGKSTIAAELARRTGWSFMDTDGMVEQRAGMPIPRIFETLGEDAFRELEYEACCEIATKDGLIAATGGGALTFERNVAALKKNGRIILLDVPFEVLQKRVELDGSRPLFRNITKARELYETRSALYSAAADIRVDGALPVKQVAETILKIMKKRDSGILSL